MNDQQDKQHPVAITFLVACYNEQEAVASTLGTIRTAMVDCEESYEILVVAEISHIKPD